MSAHDLHTVNTESTLDSCPRCGGKGSPKQDGFGNAQVECAGCGATGPFSDSVVEAVAGWNTRHPTGCVFCGCDLDADGECNECGAE